jgi:hypothetical protein
VERGIEGVIRTQAETVAAKKRTIAWICMMMVLGSGVMFTWWSFEVQMKRVEGVGFEWRSTSY